MNSTKPSETKLVICVWHPFTEWRPRPAMAEAIRRRWPEMRVLHLPNYDGLPKELPDTDIFVGYSLRAEQLRDAKKLKWIHSTAAGVAQLTEINGKVLLIVGYGSIGREVAKRARAFEMRTWGVTRSGEGDRTHTERIFSAAKLREALPEADYVLIGATEPAENRHLMGATEIAKMQRGG